MTPDYLKSMEAYYNNNGGKILVNGPQTNMDLLNKSFGGETQSLNSNPNPSPISMSPIPNSTSIDLEQTPVNLNFGNESPSVPSLSELNSIPNNMNNSESALKEFNSNNNSNISTNPGINQNDTKSTVSDPIDSPFNIGGEINIFDQPPLKSEESNIDVSQKIDFNQPITNQPQPNNETNSKTSTDTSTIETAINLKRAEMYEEISKYTQEIAKLYKALAKTQNKETNNNLENTAANLFDNNGVIDFNKVQDISLNKSA